MQFSLTEDQQAFRDTARQFATERMLPQAARWDSEKIFPVDELREAVGRLTERFADSDREAIANHQRNIEGHLARLAEEATLNRSALADELRAGGVTVHPFSTRHLFVNRFQLNFRNHRKIVVVDGERAFVGGHNVGVEYLGAKPPLSPCERQRPWQARR